VTTNVLRYLKHSVNCSIVNVNCFLTANFNGFVFITSANVATHSIEKAGAVLTRARLRSLCIRCYYISETTVGDDICLSACVAFENSRRISMKCRVGLCTHSGHPAKLICFISPHESHIEFHIYFGQKKGKSVPLKARGAQKLRFPHYVTMAQYGGKVVSLTHRPLFTPIKYSWYSFLLEAESIPGP